MGGEERPLGSLYVIGQVIGRGGMGQVHEGSDLTGRKVAIKVLRPEFAEDPAVVAGFLRERSALVKVSHPNLVPVRDLVAEGGTLAIVMDLVPGKDLRQALRGVGSVPPAEVARIGADVASALAAAHEAGVVHRDVKPENVLLDTTTRPPQVRLSDFGIAKLLDKAGTRTTGLMGTPAYLAPELFEGVPGGVTSDLYALGMMLYEMCCGVTAFAGESAASMMRSHMSVVPGRPSGIPDPLWDLIARLVAKSRADRPQSAAEVASALRRLQPELRGLGAAPVLTQPPEGTPSPHEARTVTAIAAPGRPPASTTPTPAATPAPKANRPRRRGTVVAGVLVGTLALAGMGVIGSRTLGAGQEGASGAAPSSGSVSDGGTDENQGDATAGGDPSGLGSTQSGEITVRGCEPQNPLIPTNTSETCGGNVLDQVLAKLVKYDSDDGHAEMDIAESIETDDSIKYTVKLKRDVKFHDGTEVTADNFIKAWNWGAYGPNAQLNSYFFEPIKGYADLQAKTEGGIPEKREMTGLQKVDDHEFTITMAEKTSTFPQRLGYTAFAPLPDSFFEDDGKEFGEMPIGAGPFKMVSADKNKEFVLEADPDYDRVGRPSIKKVTFKVFRESDAAYKELQDNAIDLTDEIPTDALVDDLYKEDLEARTMERTVGVFQAINFPSPTADRSYENPKLRQAISMAIDRELIIKNVFNNTREPATGWVSPVVDGYEAGACAEFCEYNKEQAKKLFDEAGGYKGTITIAYNGDASHKDWVDAACVSISDVLDVECIGEATPTFAEFRKRITERKQEGLFRAGWQMDYPSIENFLVPLYATGGSSNDGDYSNTAFDRKLKDAAAATDPDEVNELYAEAEQMLKNDMPSIPLWYSKAIGGYSENVKNAKFTVFGTYDLASITLR